MMDDIAAYRHENCETRETRSGPRILQGVGGGVLSSVQRFGLGYPSWDSRNVRKAGGH
jgi:hypothetical protein